MIELYSVYDRVSNSWQPPVGARNANEAVRGFSLSCYDPKIPTPYLSDISLHFVGRFDEVSGVIEPVKPTLTIRGDDFMIISARERWFKLNNIDTNGVDNNEISEKEDN